jgi:small nuclear ribonucleoprotein (snRNP)-like protein
MFEVFESCNSCLNRKVALHTIDGQRHEGVIVGVDEQNVYLDTSGTTSYGGATISNKKAKKAKTSAFGFGRGFGFGREREREFGFGREFGGRGSILTLALFDLLAIALIA